MKSKVSLGAFWMPFTPNREFNEQPRLVDADTFILAPPFVSTREHIDPMVERMRAAIVQTQGATP